MTRDEICDSSNVYNKMCNKLKIHETIMHIKKSERFDTLEAFQLE